MSAATQNKTPKPPQRNVFLRCAQAFVVVSLVVVVFGPYWYMKGGYFRDQRALRQLLQEHQGGYPRKKRMGPNRQFDASNPQVLRVSYFPGGYSPITRTNCVYSDGFVLSNGHYSHAIQGTGSYPFHREGDTDLQSVQAATRRVRQITAWTRTLPPDDPPRRTADLLLVSFREPTGVWTTRRYSVRRPPSAVIRFYRLLAALDKYQRPPPFVASALEVATGQEGDINAAKGTTP